MFSRITEISKTFPDRPQEAQIVETLLFILLKCYRFVTEGEKWNEEEEPEEGGRKRGITRLRTKRACLFETRPHSDTSLDWNRP